MPRLATFLVLSVAGCTSPTGAVLSANELCAEPQLLEGRVVLVEAQLDGRSLALMGSSAVFCSETEPCCNVGEYVYTLRCEGGTDVAFVASRDGLEGDSDVSAFSVAGTAPGGSPATCAPGSAPDLGPRIFEGTLSAPTTELFTTRPLRVFGFDMSATAD